MPRKVEISPFPTVLESLIFKMEKYFYERDEKKLPFINYRAQFISSIAREKRFESEVENRLPYAVSFLHLVQHIEDLHRGGKIILSQWR